MKTVGIIGGIGPESTIEYYRGIIAGFRERQTDGSYPSIIVNSIDLTKLADLVFTNRLSQAADYLVGEVHKLAKAGADFGVISANTPHIVFDEVRSGSPIPLISIVEATCDAATRLNVRRVALFGTKPTMRGHFYADVFVRAGITIVSPSDDEQTYIHDKYMNELVNGIVLPETRERLLEIAGRMKNRDSIEALILGGTELSLILPESDHKGIHFLNTTRIHVEKIVAELVS